MPLVKSPVRHHLDGTRRFRLLFRAIGQHGGVEPVQFEHRISGLVSEHINQIVQAMVVKNEYELVRSLAQGQDV